MKKNKFIAKNKSLIGIITWLPEPFIIDMIAKDWDWIWLDTQHGFMSMDKIDGQICACRKNNIPCIVRVPTLNAGHILHALDLAPDGVMVPMIDTIDQAKMAVDAAKFAPLGARSYGSCRLLLEKGPDYWKSTDANSLLILQVETANGWKNLDAIAAVKGVDVIFPGLADLAISMGFNGKESEKNKFVRDRLLEASDVASRHNKFFGTHVSNADQIETAIKCGCHLLSVGSDVELLRNGSIIKCSALKDAGRNGAENY